VFDTLSWWPSRAVESGDSIELLDRSGDLLPARLETLPDGTSGQLRFRITGAAARPAFARIRMAHGATSGIAVVMALDALRETIREARGRRAESVAARLSEETDAELWLLEALDELETAEGDRHEEDPGVRRRSRPMITARPQRKNFGL
jgi:hypothetical protein